MNERIDIIRDIIDNLKTKETDRNRFMPSDARSCINMEHSLSDNCINTSSVPLMTIDNYLERFK
jgi:hypothetical protein